MIDIPLAVSRRQKAFIDATADEVLFGGAAGGGKSYGQIIDALLYALKYPKSKQLILRRTYPELEKTLIRGALEIYPTDIYTYSAASKTGRFFNGSLLDFGYCDGDADVFRYQSAEYDVIRFDELTHFTEYVYLYLMSRVRGANDYPKQLKSTTNPGGIGHDWVKARFIDPCPPEQVQHTENGSRVFLPARVQDNPYIMAHDPEYLRRLENLPEHERRALLLGEWELTEGRFFSEFDREVHVCKPFVIPQDWRRYVAFDYGLDMLAAYWVAVDYGGRAYFYREVYQKDAIISDAAQAIRAMTPAGEQIDAYYAPPDLWNRRQDSGRSAADIFAEHGIYLTAARNDRKQGWYEVREALKVKDTGNGRAAGVVFFDTCTNALRTLPAIQHDRKHIGDVATEPHELTHAPDAVRYFFAGRALPPLMPRQADEDVPDYDMQIRNFMDYGR